MTRPVVCEPTLPVSPGKFQQLQDIAGYCKYTISGICKFTHSDSLHTNNNFCAEICVREQ